MPRFCQAGCTASSTSSYESESQRSAAAGLTAVARTAGSAISPVFAGFALTAPAIGLPFLVAGSLKSAYDLALFARFRGLKPPEELKS